MCKFYVTEKAENNGKQQPPKFCHSAFTAET
jgi:hypothetical protein